MSAMESAVRQLLVGLGEDPSREGLHDTPKRVAKALLDASTGYHQQPKDVLGTAYFNEPIVKAGGEGLVIVRDIDFASTSAETLLPFHGRCHIGYVPSQGRVLGLSKLARLTKLFAKRLQTQKQMGWQLAAALQRHLQCQGVAVVVQARQLDMATTGAQPGQHSTACISGCFKDTGSSLFQELLMLLGVDHLSNEDADHLPAWAQHAAGSLQDQQLSRVEQHQLGQHSSCCVGVASYSSHMGSPSPPPTPDLSEKEDVTSYTSLMSDMGERLSERSTSAKDVSDLCSGSVSDPGSESDTEQCEATVCCPHSTVVDRTQQPTVLLLNSVPHLLLQDVDRHSTQQLYHQQGQLQREQQPQHLHELQVLQPVSQPHQLQAQQAQAHAQQEPAQEVQHAPRSLAAQEVMQHAALQLVCSMVPCPQVQQEAADSARRYVSTLLSATSGYTRKLPAPLYQCKSPAIATDADKREFSVSAVCPHCQGTGQVQGQPDCQAPIQTQALRSACAAGALRHIKVPFNSQCEHHMLPFYGHVHVVYALSADVEAQQAGSTAMVSLLDSTAVVQPAAQAEAAAIQEVVSMYTQRLQVQERITHQVADGVLHVLGGAAAAVLVLADAAHMCMVARGVENHAGHTTSVAVRGQAVSDMAWRKRALQACQTAGLS